jgi:hypothetical protein
VRFNVGEIFEHSLFTLRVSLRIHRPTTRLELALSTEKGENQNPLFQARPLIDVTSISSEPAFDLRRPDFGRESHDLAEKRSAAGPLDKILRADFWMISLRSWILHGTSTAGKAVT